MTKKSNAVELASVLGKIKPCEFKHGSCSKVHTPLRQKKCQTPGTNSISIEMLQLLMRLGTFQLSDIFYNTVGGVLGGLMYCAVMKVRKRL